jgi:anaerobic selenocysteine-containing dehydrogenase
MKTAPIEPVRSVRAACPHDCPDTCSLLVTVQGGVAIKVQGNPAHRHTQGVLCTKVSRYAERTHHPERVLTPLKRVGAKGSGQFEPVSWQAALSDIAQRLKAIAARDAQGILPYSYAGTMGWVQGEGMAQRFFNKLGASRLERTICASAGGAGLNATYGGKFGMPVQHFAQAKVIVIWGSNPITSSVHFWALAQQAKREGAKLVCIDPRRSESAEKCYEHLALLPGTDGALALGLMNEWITHGGLDQPYIDAHVQGWPELRERALQWPVERAAATCGLTVAQIRQLAQDLAHTQPAAIRLNYGMQRVRGGGSATRLIALLPCLTGAWRHVGGGLLMSASGHAGLARDEAALYCPELLAGRTPRTVNMSTIGADLLRPASPEFGPKIEALIVYNSNPVAVAPQSREVVAGFQREDLFTVVLEHFMTDTADQADYVLPATTQLEHLDVHTTYGHTDVLWNTPAIAPLGQAKPNSQIFRELAQHMGYTEPCFAQSDEDMAMHAFKPGAVDVAALREHGFASLNVADAPFAHGGFYTPDGRAQANPDGLGVADHLPNYESAASSPELAAHYPLAFISPPARHFLNSSFVNVKSLRAVEGEPLLEMHADDAAARGLNDGDKVEVFNPRGRYHCRLAVSLRARAGVVNGMGIWWRKDGPNGTNVNELTHQRLTDIGAAPAFYDCLVQVQRAPGAPAAP